MGAAVLPAGRTSFARIAVVAIALACLAGVGDGRSQTVVPGLTIKPPAKCLPPRRPPDASIPPPEVVSTFPAQGAAVPPGLLVLRFTFNVAMSCDGVFLAMPSLPRPCEDVDPQVAVFSYDRLTIRIVCRVEGKRAYGVRMTGDPSLPHRQTFASLAGQRLRKDFELTFSTSSEPEVKSLEAAEAEDHDAPDLAR